MCTAGLEIKVDVARDILLRTGNRVPLRVFRRVREKPYVATRSESAVVVDVGREDVSNIAALILEQKRGQNAVGDAAVRIRRALGNRIEGKRPIVRVQRCRPRIRIEQTERVGGYRGDRDQQEQHYRSAEAFHLRIIAASNTTGSGGSSRVGAFKAHRFTGFQATINLRRKEFAAESSLARWPPIPVFACRRNVQGFVSKYISGSGSTRRARAATFRGHRGLGAWPGRCKSKEDL